MIHTLQLQSDELLKSNYYQLRNIMNPSTDIINLTVTHSHLQDLSTEDIYKRVLRLDGRYRTEMNKWDSPAVKVRVINQL